MSEDGTAATLGYLGYDVMCTILTGYKVIDRYTEEEVAKLQDFIKI